MSARQLNSLKERERLNNQTFIQNQKHIMNEYRVCIENMTIINMQNEARKQQMKDALKMHMENIEIWINHERRLTEFFQRQVGLFSSALQAHISFSESLKAQLEKLHEEYNKLQ